MFIFRKCIFQSVYSPGWGAGPIEPKGGRGIDQNGAENVEITVRKMKSMDSIALLVSTFKILFYEYKCFDYMYIFAACVCPKKLKAIWMSYGWVWTTMWELLSNPGPL